MQYAVRLAANPSNPTHEVTFPPNYVDLYDQKPKPIKSFGIKITPLLESTNMKPQNIEKTFTPKIPAWCVKQPEILFDLHSDVASDVGVNLCNVKSCLNTSNNEIFTDKRGDLPCVNISKHTCPVVK